MAVRVRVRIERSRPPAAPTVEATAIANSGFESAGPQALLPLRIAERLALWPPPRGARADRFDSPIASSSLVTVPRILRVSIAGTQRAAVCDAVLVERETEVVLNDHLMEALDLELLAPARGLYRIGRRGKIRKSEPPEHW